MSKNEHFYTSIKPLTIIAQIFALTSVNYENGSYTKSKYQKILALIFVGVFIYTLYVCVASSVELKQNEEMSDIYQTVYLICEIKILIRVVVIYAFRCLNREKEKDLFVLVDGVDAVIKAMGKTDELVKSNKKIFQKTLIILISGFVVAFFSELYIYYIGFSFVDPALIYMRVSSAAVATVSKCYYYMWVCVLKSRFEIINRAVDDIRRQAKLRRKIFFSLYKFEKEISLVMDLHKELTKVSRLVNGFFEVELVWHFLITFNIFFSNGYYLMTIFTRQKQNSIRHLLTVLRNYAFVGFDYYVIFSSSTRLCKQADKAINLMTNMKIDTYDEISHRMVIAYIFELKENKFIVTVYRLFDINYSTLFSMFSAISNYIFILLQLESDKFKISE